MTVPAARSRFWASHLLTPRPLFKPIEGPYRPINPFFSCTHTPLFRFSISCFSSVAKPRRRSVPIHFTSWEQPPSSFHRPISTTTTTSSNSHSQNTKTVLIIGSALGVGIAALWAYRRLGDSAPVSTVIVPLPPNTLLDPISTLAVLEDDEDLVSQSQSTDSSSSSRRLSWLCSLHEWYDKYVFEPIATTFRFFHLVCIFVPLILLVPIIWVGPRVPSKNDERRGTLWWYSLLVASMSKAGASFIKLGQWAASRTDIFPTEMCEIMSTMHSSAPAHPFSATRKVVERAFERPFEEVFSEFMETPLGVGAIAQVYRARLRPGVDLHPPTYSSEVKVDCGLGTDGVVAVKVLHPRVRRTVQRDLRIMSVFAGLLDRIPSLEWFCFSDQVSQFADMMKLQLDLGTEAGNLHKFRVNFQSRRSACFPAEYGGSKNGDLLLEQHVFGLPLSIFLANGAGVFHTQLAADGLNAFLNMLLIDNFVHADLHPGNIMVRFVRTRGHKLWTGSQKKSSDDADDVAITSDPTKYAIDRLEPVSHDREGWLDTLHSLEAHGLRPQLVFIDTGLATRLSDSNLVNFIDLFRALAEFDGLKAGTLMIERSKTPSSVIDPEQFTAGIDRIVRSVKTHTFALGNFGIGEMLSSCMALVRQHHVRLEGDFVNVILGILLLEGIGRRLDPDLDIFAQALPILRRLGTQSRGKSDKAMIKVWVGLEARSWLRAAIDVVDVCIESDLVAPNV